MNTDFNSMDTFRQPMDHHVSGKKGMMPSPGDFLGETQNYRLVKLLGEGGMGQAWLAEEIERDTVLRFVVCKIIPMAVQLNSSEMRKVETVFNLTRSLNHTNICPLYGMRSDPEFGWFFVMGHAKGPSLREWLFSHPDAENGLPLETVLKIVKPMAEALDYAHRKRVIHRDIKPENIMFSAPESDLWIIDFGIAAQIHETASQTFAANEANGTPHYMAPEQFMGELQDAKTDQYALGVVAYELLAGKRPFSGNIYAVSHQILNLAPKRIPNLPGEVNLALQRALGKRKEERFTSCEEFVKALEKGLCLCSAHHLSDMTSSAMTATANVWQNSDQALLSTQNAVTSAANHSRFQSAPPISNDAQSQISDNHFDGFSIVKNLSQREPELKFSEPTLLEIFQSILWGFIKFAVVSVWFMGTLTLFFLTLVIVSCVFSHPVWFLTAGAAVCEYVFLLALGILKRFEGISSKKHGNANRFSESLIFILCFLLGGILGMPDHPSMTLGILLTETAGLIIILRRRRKAIQAILSRINDSENINRRS